MANNTNLTDLEGRIYLFQDTSTVSDYSGDFFPTDNISTASLDCHVWGSPSRIALQVVLIPTFLLNLAAAVVVFGVPVNVRGRHVRFLFICVRTLNILDLYQCAVIFFFPLGMPPDCQNPNVIYCNISGFCFGTATILSPLVATVMALDRFIAVFFHVRYKSRPQTKLKCSLLAGLIGLYCFYFTLPFYTGFGEYIAVSWLSMCSFEWGVQYRLFNLILALATLLLTMILMAANVAIVIKVRHQKQEFDRLKASSKKPIDKRGIKMRRLASTESRNGTLFRKSKSVDDLNITSDIVKGSSKSLSERRGQRLPPLSLIFSRSRSSSLRKPKTEGRSASPNVQNDSPVIVTNSAEENGGTKINIDNFNAHLNLRQLTPSPLTHDSALLFPPSPSPNTLSPETYRPPSPLIMDETGLRKPSPRMVTKHTLIAGRNRVSSAESLLDNKDCVMSTFGHVMTDPNKLRKKALGNIGTSKRIASSEPILDRSPVSKSGETTPNSLSREFSTTNSMFSNFIGSRLMSWRTRTVRPTCMRRNVSRITKMTTAICTLFTVLYVPFLVRKLVQVIPYEYTYVPYGVEIVTLFGPLLSPLCNPILYVFFNPHYKENCKRLYRKCVNVAKGKPHADDGFYSTKERGRSWRWKSSRSGTQKRRKAADSSDPEKRAESNPSIDDVFISPGNHKHGDGVSNSETPLEHSSSEVKCSPPATPEDPRRRQSLRQLHLRKVQNIQFRRVNSEDYLN